MKIVLTCSVIPFSGSGLPWFFESLGVMLGQAGHDVEKLTLPYTPNVPDVLDQRLALRLLDVSSRSDMLIAIGIPAYLLQHPRKVVWLNAGAEHTAGQRHGRSQAEILAAARLADDRALREAKQLFATSDSLANQWRAAGFPKPSVLYPALFHEQESRPEPSQGTFLFCHSLRPEFRPELALQSLAQTLEPVRLVMGGCSDNPDLTREIRKSIEQLGLQDRVQLSPETLSNDLLGNCLASLYLPAQEVCYSSFLLKEICARRCVITTMDSGAANELLGRDPEGLTLAPEPSAIAFAVDRVFKDRRFAARRADTAYTIIRDLNIGASQVLERLLS